MFRVLYGIKDKEVRTSLKTSTSAMLSNSNLSRRNGEGNGQYETSSHVKKGGPGQAGMYKNASLRFPGFSKQDKQIKEEADEVWITLNVGGCIYSTTTDTLLKHPAQRLNRLAEDTYNKTKDEKPMEYKYDRNAAMFSFFLDYMRTGELHIPHDTCIPFFRRELEFWGIPEDAISVCCWPRYKAYDEDHSMLEKVRKHFLTDLDHYRLYLASLPSDAYVERYRWKTWIVLEYPYSSIWAKLWAVLYIFFVLISIFCLIVDTHKDFRVDSSSDRLRDLRENNTKILLRDTTDPHPVINYLDLLTSLIFSVEILLRFCICPDKKEFFKSFLTWTDVGSLVAQWILFGLLAADVEYWQNDSLWRLFEACSVIRVFRVFRIFRLAKHYTGLQILCLALQASARELIFLVMFVGIGMLLFATFIFYAEFNTEDIFPNIPESFWWAIITMTTVGYGDAAPVSGWGYFVGALCALCGIVTIGLPIPIIATNFKIFYDYANLTQRMKGKQSFELENISVSKIRGKLFKDKKDNNDRKGGSGVSERVSSKGSLGSNSSRKSNNSKIHPLSDPSQVSTSKISPVLKSENTNITFGAASINVAERRPLSEIGLERSDSEEGNDLIPASDNITDDRSRLVRPKTRGKYPTSRLTKADENQSKNDRFPMNNFDLDNVNGNNNDNTEKALSKEPDILVLHADTSSETKDEEDSFSDLPENGEILFDPRGLKTTPTSPPPSSSGPKRPDKPAPPPRTSSLNTQSDPKLDQTPIDSDRNDALGRPWNPTRAPGLPEVEDDHAEQSVTPRAPLSPINRPSRPMTSRYGRSKKKKEKRRKGFMML